MNVLVACEYSGRVRDAFIARGHMAMSCDLLETEVSGPHYKGDIRDVTREGFPWDLLVAHPPCTRMTNAGSRWLVVPPPGKTLPRMWADLHEAVAFYKFLRSLPIRRKALENPLMHCHARALLDIASRQVVQPWWFGDEAFKATGFELIGLPPLVATARLVPPPLGSSEHKRWSAIHRAAPGPDRWKFCSRTFQGIADAMADQWGG